MKQITSPQNAEIKRLKRLLTKASFRAEQGLYIVEGHRAVRDTPPELIESVYQTAAYAERYGAVEASGRKAFLLSDACMDAVSGTETAQGILATVRIREFSCDEILQSGRFLLALDRIMDPGNMGTLIRTAEAAGVDGILVSKGSVDMYNPKVVRSAMSSLSRQKIAVYERPKDLLEKIQSHGFISVVSCLEESVDYREIEPADRIVLFVGNEANGVQTDILEEADRRVRIPMSGAIESLNAAVAGGILLYEIRNRMESGDRISSNDR